MTPMMMKSFGLVALLVLGGLSSTASGSLGQAHDNIGASGKHYHVSEFLPAPGKWRYLPATSTLHLYAPFVPGHSLEIPSFSAGRYMENYQTDLNVFNGPSTATGKNPFGLEDLLCDIRGPKSRSASIKTTMTAVRLFAQDHFRWPVDFDNNTVSGVEGHYHFRDTTGFFRKKIFTFVYKHDLKCTNGPITSEYDAVYYTYVLSAMQCANNDAISSFTVRDGCTTAMLNIDSVAM